MHFPEGFSPIDLAFWCFCFVFFMRFARFQILICEFIFIDIHIIFNPNQEKNLWVYKVVDNSKNLNSVHLEQAYCTELTLNKVFQKSNLFLICFWIFSAHKLTYLTLAKSLLKSYETVSRLIMKIWNQKTLQLSLTLMLSIRLEKNSKPIQQSPLRIVHLSTRKERKFWLNLWWQRTWFWNGKVWKAGGTDIAYCFFWHLAFA